jgi:hypothetical protein
MSGGAEDTSKFVATLRYALLILTKIISRSSCLLARCQGQEKRVCVTLRPTEGEYGELSVTIVAALTPKVAKVR